MYLKNKAFKDHTHLHVITPEHRWKSGPWDSRPTFQGCNSRVVHTQTGCVTVRPSDLNLASLAWHLLVFAGAEPRCKSSPCADVRLHNVVQAAPALQDLRCWVSPNTKAVAFRDTCASIQAANHGYLCGCVIAQAEIETAISTISHTGDSLACVFWDAPRVTTVIIMPSRHPCSSTWVVLLSLRWWWLLAHTPLWEKWTYLQGCSDKTTELKIPFR